MDWDWKEFAWDPVELELSAGGIGEEQVDDTALMGLRLGEAAVAESRSMAERVNDPKASKTVSSPSRSAKRLRVQNGSQSITCLVDGCNSDLGNCRDYHRRHRVCEQHSKAPIVVVGGKQQRFCQQCSRFHALGEFDEVKRSCRKRLDGHNRRRRKPQPPSLFMSGGRFLPICKGPRILQFNNPQIYGTPGIRSMWPAIARNDTKSKTNEPQQHWDAIDLQLPASYLAHRNRGRGTQFSLMQANHTGEGPGVSASTLPLSGTAVSPGSGKGSQSHPDATTRSIDLGCALYLLSSHSAPASELSMMRSTIGPPAHSHNTELQIVAVDKQPSLHGMKNKPSCPVLVQNADTNNTSYNGMLRTGGLEGPVGTGDPLTPPFSWEQ